MFLLYARLSVLIRVKKIRVHPRPNQRSAFRHFRYRRISALVELS
jgi:hypothetical protein